MKSKTAEEIYREVHAKYGGLGGKPDKYDLEAMEAYASQSKWIPVEERLPENDEDVLLAHSEDKWQSIGYRTTGGFYNNSDHDTLCYPTHWQPLPTSPTKTT